MTVPGRTGILPVEPERRSPLIGDRDVLVLYDERMLEHQPEVHDPYLPGRLERRVREILDGLDVKWSYPEHPGRLTAIRELLEEEPVPGVRFDTGAAATREQLGRVHTMSYLDDIETLRGKSAWLDEDTTAISKGSIEAAEVAAGTAVKAVEAVLAGGCDSAFALVRPPGHHAEPVRARGFCLFNNVAVAAAHAQAALGRGRVLIIDWDAHHANGTQDIFWADPDVMLFDTHRGSPFYPGSGELEEVGGGRGRGTTVNVPLPEGSGDLALLTAFREILIPAARWFEPDLILVSAGYDPHRLDLALNVGYDGFAAITEVVRDLADELCDGRLALVLEGGYHLESLARGVRTTLEVLSGGDAFEPEEVGVREVRLAAEYHLDAFSDD
ncbi:MAG: histone deacetylase [Gammaproteobacteria bacterium]|nr:histone deacetylase [Gammaproteobacteria bacterium]